MLKKNNEKIGLLVEGWNKGWNGNCLFKFIEDWEYNDFDLSKIMEKKEE